MLIQQKGLSLPASLQKPANQYWQEPHNSLLQVLEVAASPFGKATIIQAESGIKQKFNRVGGA
jgi:hypothetical protein